MAAGPVNRFDKVLNDAKGGITAKELGGSLVQLRSQLSKENPLNPVLFELSMEAGRLKSLGSKSLAGADLSYLNLGRHNLHGADLREANLQGALLTSEQLVSAILDETTTLPDGSNQKAV